MQFSQTCCVQVTNCAKVNTQRSFADITAALALAEAELQQLRSSAAAGGGGGGGGEEVAGLRAAADAELQRRVMLEGELQAWREREAAVCAGADSSRNEAEKCKADVSKYCASPLRPLRAPNLPQVHGHRCRPFS